MLEDAEIDYVLDVWGIPQEARLLIDRRDGRIGRAFCLLARQEERMYPEIRDAHGRVVGSRVRIATGEPLGRPIVDIWGREFRDELRKSGAHMPPEDSAGFGHIYLTHDVDNPYAWSNLKSVLIGMASRVVCSPSTVLDPPLSYYGLKSNVDPYDTFDWLLEQDAKIVDAFGRDMVTPIYFVMANGSRGEHDGHCYLKCPAVRKLLEKLIASGVEIGLHSSYQAGGNTELVSSEKRRLEDAIGRAVKLNRHHYLRSMRPEDMYALEDAGITDDFTLGYADVAGFRVGTCRPYKWFESRYQEVSNLTIHPLSIMECTLSMTKYMGLAEDAAFQKCREIIDGVYSYRGDLVLLWHNTSVKIGGDSYQRSLYDRVNRYLLDRK